MMTSSEKVLIEQYAAMGQDVLKEKVRAARLECVAIFRARLREGDASRGTKHMRFMAEVDNPCPDPLLRARYRAELLGRKFP